MEENELYFCKLSKDARIPSKRDEDVGYDFYPCFEESYIFIQPGETVAIPTGIAMALHPSKYLKLEEKSSIAKRGIKVSGGIIDSGYRGDVTVLLYNTTKKTCVIERVPSILGPTRDDRIFLPYDKAICQGIVYDSHKMKVKEVLYEDLMSIGSERGTGGFGSTGK